MSLLGVLRATQDLCGGVILTGSPNVFINGFPVVRVGDQVGALVNAPGQTSTNWDILQIRPGR